MCEAESVRYITACIFMVTFIVAGWDLLRRVLKGN